MKRFILACFFFKAVIASFDPSSQIAEQSSFQVQQGDTDHNLNDTQLFSKVPKTPLCGVNMRTNKYADRCDNLYKDMFVCKIKEDRTRDCDKFQTPLQESEEYALHDCDHILDLHIFTKTLTAAGLCDDMDFIRETYAKSTKFKTNELYLVDIKTTASMAKYLNYLDRRVHKVKNKIITRSLSKEQKKIKKPKHQWTSELLMKYYEDSFKPHGKAAAQEIDEEAYNALMKMVNDIKNPKDKEWAEYYVNHESKISQRVVVQAAYQAASETWEAVVASWSEDPA